MFYLDRFFGNDLECVARLVGGWDRELRFLSDFPTGPLGIGEGSDLNIGWWGEVWGRRGTFHDRFENVDTESSFDLVVLGVLYGHHQVFGGNGAGMKSVGGRIERFEGSENAGSSEGDSGLERKATQFAV